VYVYGCNSENLLPGSVNEWREIREVVTITITTLVRKLALYGVTGPSDQYSCRLVPPLYITVGHFVFLDLCEPEEIGGEMGGARTERFLAKTSRNSEGEISATTNAAR
jgi:hypothetical protein